MGGAVFHVRLPPRKVFSIIPPIISSLHQLPHEHFSSTHSLLPTKMQPTTAQNQDTGVVVQPAAQKMMSGFDVFFQSTCRSLT